MNQAEGGRQKGSGAAIAAIILLLLPLLYVLSIGPASMLVEYTESDTALKVYMFVYCPVILLYDNTPLQAPLDWYVDLWV